MLPQQQLGSSCRNRWARARAAPPATRHQHRAPRATTATPRRSYAATTATAQLTATPVAQPQFQQLSAETDQGASQQSTTTIAPAISTPANGTAGQQPDPRQEALLASLNGRLPSVPCSFLYDTRGSELYEEITQLPEYYPFEAEKKLLAAHLEAVTAHIPSDSVILELGCGVADKTAPLLQALLDRHGPGQEWVYVGLDVSESALTKARQSLLQRVGGLRADQVDTVCAEYLEGVRLTCRKYPGRRVTMLWLGSSIGNLSTDEAVAFLEATQREASGADIQMLLCTDLWKDTERLRAAYDDSQGVTREFILNGMAHALRTLGQAPAAAIEDLWQYVVKVNEEHQRVEMWLVAKQRVSWPGGGVEAGEPVLMELSRKYTLGGVRGLAETAGFIVQDSWSDGTYAIHLLVPPMAALATCWAASDQLFADIADWQCQPIELRHPLGFYYGHVAAFCKLKVLGLDAAATGGLDYLLSRGMDPLVDDPSRCHDHPPVPSRWPSKDEMTQYVLQARGEVKQHLKQPGATRHGALRQVAMVLEHEWMHQETMWHLLLQQRKALLHSQAAASSSPVPLPRAAGSTTAPSVGSENIPPPHPLSPPISGTAAPRNGASTATKKRALAAAAAAPAAAAPVAGIAAAARQPFAVSGATNAVVAMVTAEAAAEVAVPASAAGAAPCGTPQSLKDELVEVPGGMVVLGVPVDGQVGYVWDNEGPPQAPVWVGGFRACRRSVSIGDFWQFVAAGGYDDAALWRQGDLAHLGRLGVRRAPATWSVQADGSIKVHLVDGTFDWHQVAERPAWVSLAEAEAYVKWVGGGARIMTEPEYCLALQQDPQGASIIDLQSGGYEWTTTPFHPYQGFAPSPEYPEYSTDFFDDQHFSLRGASPVTAPGMRRGSFRNFYQRLFPFAFTKFRLAYPLAGPQ